MSARTDRIEAAIGEIYDELAAAVPERVNRMRACAAVRFGQPLSEPPASGDPTTPGVEMVPEDFTKASGR